jgi:segregation and condensation protein A
MGEEPVEILVRMAERGEIDPWNIDIVEVTDRFLRELDELRQRDLRISGRTLFYASVLLRMKSEHLGEAIDEEGAVDDEGFPEPDEPGFDGREYLGPVERLEREIRRRIERKHLRTRPVTLYELIRMLKTAEREECRRRRTRHVVKEPDVDVDEVVGVAHEEGFHAASAAVWQGWEDLSPAHEKVSLSDLCGTLGRSVPDVYIPLLFLMLEGRLAISQKDFFDEVFIERPKAPRAEEPEQPAAG